MNRSISSLAAALLLVIVHVAFAAEPAHVPATPQAAANANLIARADHALRDYSAACSTGDDEALARTLTSDAILEYPLEEPGMYIAVEALAHGANCFGRAEQAASRAHISSLWIFPTNDSNTVFVQYTMSSDVGSPAEVSDSEHLALIEMRGNQIAKMRDFSAGVGNLPTLPEAGISRVRAREQAR
jgi:hypothetical protein